MQIESIDLAQLQPAPYNPRVRLQPGMPAYQRLERSLEEFDLVQPIVWNRRTGHVVGGHQRLEILKRRGDTHVDCVVVDLSLEREQALNIALNNERLASQWDEEKLADLLTELTDVPDFDVSLTGFSANELRDLVFTPALDPAVNPADLDDEDSPDRDVVRVQFEAPLEDWNALRTAIDTWVADHPRVQLHVRLPSTASRRQPRTR
jgi:ParB-like chromosome segregation protein Spo0J